MRTSWRPLVLVATALLAAPSVLLADDPPAGEDRAALFKKLDANSDGTLSGDEIPAEQQRLFKRLLRSSDQDGNGQLSREEFLAATKEESRPAAPGGSGGADPAQREAMFKRLDANGDGKLVADEAPPERREDFLMLIERADADGDKALTIVEFTKGLEMRREGQGDRPKGRKPESPDGKRPGGGPETLFRALDSNGDGRISREEAYTAGDALKKLDKNGDEAVSRTEAGLAGPPPQGGDRPGGQTPNAKAFVERQDRNGDGKLSKDELPEQMRGMRENFARVDTDSDGFIDVAELEQAFRAFQGTRGQGQPGGGGGQYFKQLDKDGDGKISKDEAPERMREGFARLDANGDGFLVIEEFQRAAGGRGQGGDPAARFKELDKDDDGKLSKDEAPDRIRDNFDRIDSNSDGSIDLDEFRQAMNAGRGRGGDGQRRPPNDDSK